MAEKRQRPGRDSGSQQDREQSLGPAIELIEQAQKLFDSNLAESARLARKALELARADNNLSAAAQALNLIADTERMEGRMDSSFSLTQEALECAKAAGDERAKARAISTLGSLAWHRGEFDLAIQWFEQTLALREKLEQKNGVAACCSNLSLMYCEKGDLARALDYQQRSLEIRERIGDRDGIGVSYLNLGMIYVDLGDWDKALESYFRALAEKERAKDKAHMALCYNNIGELYLNRGKLDRAKFYLEKALELAEAAHAPWVKCEVLGTLGEAAFAARDLGRAQDLYEQDRAICLETNDREELAETLRRWAELDLVRKEVASARTKLDEALEICTQTGLRREEGNVRRVLGQLLAATEDVTGAKQSLEQSIVILKSLGNNYELACSLLALGRLQSETGQDGKKLLAQAVSIFRNLGVLFKATEAERLLGPTDAGTAQVDLMQDLTELVCQGLDTGGLCEQALNLLAEKAPGSGAAVFLRDGRVFRHSRVEPGADTAGITLPLEVGGRRLGTLVLRTDGEPSRFKTIADLLALGLAQAQSKPAALGLETEKPESRFPDIIGADTSLARVFETIERVAPTRASVLVLGESGTGKELVARTLHRLSDRSGQPFVAVNCAAIPENLLETELFGIEKGTATGVTARPGKFETADRGTVFLDEIGDMSLALQAKMLRVLQERAFERVGGREPVKIDVRIVAATNQDLEKAMADGKFRRDLFYRLNVITVSLPPLRERKQDIPALVAYFTGRVSQEYSKPVRGVTDDCLACLMGCPWPGNVRELENVIERGVILARGELVTVEDLPSGLQPAARHEPKWQDARKKAEVEAAAPVEKSAIVAALEQSGWVVKRAATKLGISRRHLYRVMEKYGIKRKGVKG